MLLHPSVARALATAHIEDQLRAAARWRTIRLALRARAARGSHEPRAAATLSRRAVIRVDSTTWTAPAEARGMTRTEIPQTALWPCQSVVDVRTGPQAGIDPASSKARPAQSHTRASCGSG
jgi:hypothetical protein